MFKLGVFLVGETVSTGCWSVILQSLVPCLENPRPFFRIDYLGFSIVNPWTELFLFEKYFINWTSSFFDSLSQICLKISEWWKYRLRSNSFILRIIKYYKIRRTILNHFLIEFQNCICYTVRATFFNRGGLNFRKVKNEYFYIFLIE